jgi:hypothetical protein
MVKNRDVPIKRYFKWWTSIKLVCARYQIVLFLLLLERVLW